MRSSVLIAALAAASLAACQAGPRTVAGVCKPFPAGSAQPLASDGAGVLEDCLHRWAYTLAASRDDAGMVSNAVVAACGAPLARWNQQAMSQAAGADQPAEAPSLLTGENTTPIGEHAAFAQGRALFYVVQARAGGCKPPSLKSDGSAAAPDK